MKHLLKLVNRSKPRANPESKWQKTKLYPKVVLIFLGSKNNFCSPPYNVKKSNFSFDSTSTCGPLLLLQPGFFRLKFKVRSYLLNAHAQALQIQRK